MQQEIRIVKYNDSLINEWNWVVSNSKNGTFLLNRNFMDYHKERFNDCSLMFTNEKGKFIACLPANYDSKNLTVYSHQGLTYGGFILLKDVTALNVETILNLTIDYYRQIGANKIIYKPIPSIYSSYPSEEDLYFLFRHNAHLIARGLSQTIIPRENLTLNKGRKYCRNKAIHAGLQVMESPSDIEGFWTVLNDTLQNHHNVSPVHSVAELQLLINRFPKQIRLYVVKDTEQNILAGSLVFDTGKVVHTQYMAASEQGKQIGALDLLITTLVSKEYYDKPFFDFGISTEDGGRILNEGLLYQKESFGGRSICYDSWELNISE